MQKFQVVLIGVIIALSAIVAIQFSDGRLLEGVSEAVVQGPQGPQGPGAEAS